MKAKLQIKKSAVIDQIDDRLYGSFIEHLGRAVYSGIYEPTHETADDQGFRKDVLDYVKKLNVPIIRYPGGNFVSGYNWEDGIGDKSKRPHKLDLAWDTIETNEVGIDEFQEWAKRANSEILMTVNLGTRGPEEARQLVEYCNMETDTYYANLRRANGFEKPFGIKTWCLGNEMDGPWQMGSKTPMEYARVARETAKMMKWVDPSIELVACGSSGPNMKTWGEWERTVLREAYDLVDYISLHSYYGNPDNNTEAYLAKSLVMDNFICKTIEMCDEIQKEKGVDKKINLSFDEWNVWFHSNESDKKLAHWQIAPPRLEDIYNLEDALVVGCLLITLLKHCDRVKIACLAQLVNVIAPIMTERGGRAWAQTIFYPFMQASAMGRGTALNVETDCETYDAGDFKNVPYLETVAVESKDASEVNLFVVNRSLKDSCELDIALEGYEGYKVVAHSTITGDDLKAVNTADKEMVAPADCCVANGVVLPKQSWNVITLKK